MSLKGLSQFVCTYAHHHRHHTLAKSLISSSLTKVLVIIAAKREKEILTFFTSVRKLCTKKQVGKFDEIIEKALKNGPHRPPHDRRPPPRDF